ncbi:hypothetical protein DL93DRAFT_2052703 [Clavulina sp. PMI_390]|nr:hypothetical protein DL93DRAFT_2052703 [Clavulina sp. PMI_390]
MAEVQTPAQAPFPVEFKSLEKVQGIPVVHDSLGYAHSLLSTNPYTSYVYNTGLGFTNTVYDYSKPVQARLAPILVRADGIALQGINAVESRFPYPFQTPTEEVCSHIIGTLKQSSDQAYSAFDARVRTPAYGLAQTADKSLSPIVDKLELAINKLSPPATTSEEAPAPAAAPNATESSSQIERAYKLSVQARDQIVLLSSEQIKEVQKHSVIVQRAMDTIYKLNGSVQAIGKDAQTRVHAASAGIMSEVEKVQSSAAALPSKVQTSTEPLQSQLSQTLVDLKTALQSEGPASQKAKQLASAVQNQIGPILEALSKTYTNFTGAPAPAAPKTNGAGNESGAPTPSASE